MSANGVRETRAFASETKFLVPLELAEPLREWARRHLTADPHGGGLHSDEYHTTTLYFDTPEFDVFHRRASYGRSKYRIRRYNGSAEVFLERKLRRPGILAKRRTAIEMDALEHLDAHGTWPGRWFERRLSLRKLRPICEISYHRVARAGEGALGPIRFTLDERLRVLPINRPAFTNRGDGRPFLEKHLILELKYRASVPLLFKQLAEEFALLPRPVSKYRLGMAALEPATLPAVMPALEADDVSVAGSPGA